ncbi:MAG: GDSL-type esterase/lipase family protein, partial [Lentisphaeria bacterium]
MKYLLKHPRLAIVLLLAALLFGFWLYRKQRLNHWDLKNHPPSDQTVVCFGDSLVYGSGATGADSTYPAQLKKITGLEVKVFGFPGATSRSALKILRNNPRVKGGIVIVTLGGNDFLRQVPLSQTRQYLKQVFEILQGRGALVVYTGVPGGRTAKYKKLCKNTGVVLVPDVLDNILSQRNLRA